jgi:hypothetical protein
MAAILSRLIAIFAVLSSFTVAYAIQQPARPKPPQTPRQALIEIITGGGKAVQKHITVEIQQMISEASKKKDPSDKTAAETLMMFQQFLTMPSLAGQKDLQTFDSGPVLLSFVPGEKQKLEVHLEADDLSGDLDTLQLSIHWLKDGQELNIPFMPIIVVGLKHQENIWRLNEIGGNAKLVVGDPRFFADLVKFQQSEEQDSQQRQKPKAEAAEKPEPPKLPTSSVVSMLAYAEMRYARVNPDVGFTCNIADLFTGKDAGFSEVLDPQIATGTYNGYRFTVTGCDGKPASVFHMVAEPLSMGSGSQAFCTDPTHNIRTSDDGRGGTCLASGTIMKTEVSPSID